MLALIAFLQTLNAPVVYVAEARNTVEIINVDTLIRLKAQEYGLNVELVSAIIECESGGIIDATHTNKNGSVDRGLLQINSIHNTEGLNMLDPKHNLDFGLAMMKKQGTEPWKYSKHCWADLG